MARISRGALRANLALLHEAGTASLPAELPADAWGHGAATVQAVLDEAGATVTADRLATLLGLPGGDPRARPVMRLGGHVLGTKELRAGEGVSYGLTFRAAADTRIVLVTGGYAQGVVRALGNRASVTCAGTTCPIVGRVAMDVCVVEIGDAHIGRGDEAMFFGDPRDGEPALADWVGATGMTAQEIVSLVGARASRREVA